jgi:kynurenine formamidase
MAELIELSREIYHEHPLFELHPPTVVWTHHTYEEAEEIMREQLGGHDPPFVSTTKTLQFCDHGPTHADALAHYGPGGATIDEMSLDSFDGPATAIAVTKYDGSEDTSIEPEDVEEDANRDGASIAAESPARGQVAE